MPGTVETHNNVLAMVLLMSLHFEDFISLACFGLSLLAVFMSVSALSVRRPGCYPQLSFLSLRDKHMTVYEQFILKGVRAD